ncbi:MAG: GAF domain-containing protein [Pseudomonadota bacterium]|nr:GAF domain-containing protein [Pseudomonadota bacterium]
MQARLIAYPPDSAAITRLIGAGEVLRVGRVPDPDHPRQLSLGHPSVSRYHAEFRTGPHGWRVVDCGSKNGTFVEGSAVRDVTLAQPCWLRFGDVYCEFSPTTAEDIGMEQRRLLEQRAAATAHTQRIGGLVQLGDLLDASLRAVLELTQCERGFVLIDEGSERVVRASLSLDPAALGASRFRGSIGAVRRALEQRRPVVVNEIGGQAWLASRQSVMAAGLTCLVCLPLLDGPHVLGAIYVDRVSAGPPINTLDIELLEAFAENASVWIAARRASEQIAGVQDARAPAWRDIVAAHTEDPE